MNQETVLVTGASRGIGEAIARALSRNGYKVIGTYLPAENIEEPIDGVDYIKLDLNDLKSVKACIEKIRDVDILINNAGQSQIGPAEEYPIDRSEELFQTNLFGAMRLILGFLPGMRERRKGVIMNIGSMAGEFAVPFQSVYVATKFALAGYTWALRNEVMKFGIRIVAILPNDIRTTITPDVCINDESEYREDMLQMKHVRDKNMEKAPGPEVVARKVMRILKKRRPKPFYAVGGMGPLFVFLKRLLPDRITETLVRKNYGL
jgi:short-subunit dehydrogenase